VRIPIISFEKLWHLGDLDISRKHACGHSQEGNLFSMSRCPAAWQQIVKLGGAPLYEGDTGYTLLDMLSVTHPSTKAGKQLKSVIRQWAYDNAMLEEGAIVQGHYFDDELGRICVVNLTQEEADSAEPDEYDVLHTTSVDLATEKLKSIHNLKKTGVEDAFDFAVIEWARGRSGAKLDGVYWNQAYNPKAYSAPRAGIFEAKIQTLVKLDGFPGDEQELVQVGKVQWRNLTLEPNRAL
jgi:hypothetical protein